MGKFEEHYDLLGVAGGLMPTAKMGAQLRRVLIGRLDGYEISTDGKTIG